MISYDVVELIQPGTPTSRPAGRWLIESHATEAQANERGELFKRHTELEGVTFVTEAHEELSELRANYCR